MYVLSLGTEKYLRKIQYSLPIQKNNISKLGIEGNFLNLISHFSHV